jgi:hypothetical protein
VSHANPEAARLADKLRTAMKDRALRGPAIADEVERLTGERPKFAAQWISRRLSGEKALIRVSPDLYVLAEIAGLDPVELIVGALVEQTEGPVPEPAQPIG